MVVMKGGYYGRILLAVFWLLVGGCALLENVVPGHTQGSAELQRDTLRIILALDWAVDSVCKERNVVDTQVAEPVTDLRVVAGRVVGGKSKERWYLDRCGKVILYDVQYTADGKGGTFISAKLVE